MIGIPYKNGGRDENGLDCIGLVIYYLNDKGYNIPVDLYSYQDSDGPEAAAIFMNEIFRSEMGKGKWIRCGAQEDALVAFRIKGAVRHAGIMINDHMFYHVMKNTKVTMESINDVTWKNRVAGFYRWSK